MELRVVKKVRTSVVVFTIVRVEVTVVKRVNAGSVLVR